LSLAFGLALVLLSLITYFFFNEYNRGALPLGVPVSRFILGVGGFFALYFVILARIGVWALEQVLYSFGFGRINVALIGDKQGRLTKYLMKRLDVGHIYNYPRVDKDSFAAMQKMLKNNQLHEIYLFSSQSPMETDLARLSELHKASFIFSPEGFIPYTSFAMQPLSIDNRVFLELKHTNLDGWSVVLKRLFDVTLALLVFLFFGWLYILVALAIKLDSPGSILYGSERVGPNGKTFKLWKFRRFKQEYCTSESDPKAKKALEFEQKLIAEKNMRGDGPLYKIKDDPRFTRVGKFIEKYSLDELPQFINVLLGNMSVVGPRPHQPREVAKYANHHFKVLNIKPGITGLAQINGRSDLSFEDEVSYDTFYVEHWSFWLDLWIVCCTPFVILFKSHKA
jgi:lipopolysaccharide/colanic/teichoic acid biosynthesis glycosyltransferase